MERVEIEVKNSRLVASNGRGARLNTARLAVFEDAHRTTATGEGDGNELGVTLP